jgi:hypothetical protein
MKTAGLFALAAAPGVAAAYLLLSGYLLARIRPAPITVLPLAAGSAGARPVSPSPPFVLSERRTAFAR